MDSISGKQFRQLLSRKRTGLFSLDEANKGSHPILAVPESSSAPFATHNEPINSVFPLTEPPLCEGAQPTLPEATFDHEQDQGMLDSDDEHDDQVSIPMRKIDCSDRSFDEEPSCEAGGPSLKTLPSSPSSIPVRSPSRMTKSNAAVLALPTPFKNYIFYRDTPASPSQLSTQSLIQMLDAAHQSVPTVAIWKKLSILVPQSGLSDRCLFVERVDALLSLVPIPDLAFVGGLLKSMLHVDRALFRARERVILRILLTLSKYFEFHSTTWQDPPLCWVQIEPDHDIETIWAILRDPEARDDADLINAGMTFLHGFVRSATEGSVGWPVLNSCLISALELWIEAGHTKVKKASVALLVAIRKRTGDPLFFQSLPLLSPSQRCLLDAYNSLDPPLLVGGSHSWGWCPIMTLHPTNIYISDEVGGADRLAEQVEQLTMASSNLERRPSLLSPDDVDKLYHSFLRIDSDGNGVIDRNELLKIPAIAGNPLAPRLLELFDTDRSGDINFSEFVAGLAVFSSKANCGDRLKFAFDVYDLDQDGFISNGELFLVLRMMTGDHLKPVQLQQIVDKSIRDADQDKDGRISFEEFANFVERRNGDFMTRWSVADL